MCVCPQDVHSPLRGQRPAVWSGFFFCVWAVRLMCLYPLSHLIQAVQTFSFLPGVWEG